jgi:hypothetical protein
MKQKKRSSDPVQPLYSEEELRIAQLRGKVRALTALCLDCKDIDGCPFGRQLEELYEEHCRPQVGKDLRHCYRCRHTLDGTCAVDRAQLAAELHAQLAECTRKRGFGMPFVLARWDILFPRSTEPESPPEGETKCSGFCP